MSDIHTIEKMDFLGDDAYKRGQHGRFNISSMKDMRFSCTFGKMVEQKDFQWIMETLNTSDYYQGEFNITGKSAI